MLVKKSMTFDRTRSGAINEPSTCPFCKRAIKPQELAEKAFKNEANEWFYSLLYLCKSCYQSFVAQYNCGYLPKSDNSFHAELSYIGPSKYAEQHFDVLVEDLSPQFVKIFNQAAAAEDAGLDEIAGLGYRKAVEFLTKDFCIHLHPDKEEDIKARPLASCISTHIDNEQIKTLATRIAWLGNDEAHYIRKQTDRDIEDMKNFIRAMVHFIGMSLIVEDAASMSPA